MGYPTFQITIGGTKMLFDVSQAKVIKFDNFAAVNLAANAYRSLEVGGIDYVIPAGKKLMLIKADALDGDPAWIDYGTTTVADVATGWVLLHAASTINRDPYMVEIVAGKYVTVRNRHATVALSFTVTNLVGLEVNI